MARVRPTPALLTLLTFASGAAALGYEVLYVRHLTTLLGDMLYVHAALLSMFLVGVGAGSVWAHRGWGRLWALELGTGLYALLLPTMTGIAADSPSLAGVTGAATSTVLATAAFVAIPALLIGFSLPLFSGYIRAVAPDRSVFRGTYAAYNAGAVLGVLLVELTLVRHFGVRGGLATLGAVNVIVGLVLLVLETPGAEVKTAPRVFRLRGDIALMMGSVASAIFQMHLFQTVYLVYGPHRENFAVGLAVILAGVALGGPVTSFLRLRLEHALWLAAVSVPLMGLFFGPLVDVYGGLVASMGSGISVRLLMGSAFGLIPLIFFGALIPAALRSETAVARDAGRLLWISSWANAAGYLLYVLWLHEQMSGAGLALVLAGLSATGALLMASSPRARWLTVMSTAAVCMSLPFVWSDTDFYLAQWRGSLDENVSVETIKRGGESATLIRERTSEWVSYNGHPSIVVTEGGVVNQAEILSGVIPALAAPSLARGLVLGLGAGITGGAMARLFERTDVVEINASFLAMMPRLRHVNFGIQNHAGAVVHHADGRTFLNGREGQYDAILNSVPTPTYYSASKIYTLEFYRKVAVALKPGGVFATWLSSGDLTDLGVVMVLRTLAEVFEYCDLRALHGDYVMSTCSQTPLRLRSPSSIAGFGTVLPLLATSFDGLDPDAFFEAMRLSENVLEGVVRNQGDLNTDDLPRLEFLLSGGRGERSLSLFADDPEQFAIDWVRPDLIPDTDVWIRRAGTLQRLANGAYRKWLGPVIAADSTLMLAWARAYPQRNH